MLTYKFFSLFEAISDLPGLYDKFAANLDYALPFIFYYDHHSLSVQKSITTKIKDFYFDNKLTRDKALNMTNVWDVHRNFMYMIIIVLA